MKWLVHDTISRRIDQFGHSAVPPIQKTQRFWVYNIYYQGQTYIKTRPDLRFIVLPVTRVKTKKFNGKGKKEDL